MVRSFLACKRARLEVLVPIWESLERRVAAVYSSRENRNLERLAAAGDSATEANYMARTELSFAQTATKVKTACLKGERLLAELDIDVRGFLDASPATVETSAIDAVRGSTDISRLEMTRTFTKRAAIEATKKTPELGERRRSVEESSAALLDKGPASPATREFLLLRYVEARRRAHWEERIAPGATDTSLKVHEAATHSLEEAAAIVRGEEQHHRVRAERTDYATFHLYTGNSKRALVACIAEAYRYQHKMEEVAVHEENRIIHQLKRTSHPAGVPEEIRGMGDTGRSSAAKHLAIADRLGVRAETIAAYAEVFSLVDLDNGGTIECGELEKLLNLLGTHKVTTSEVEEIVTEIDTTGTGSVHFEDFCGAMLQTPTVKYSTADVVTAFRRACIGILSTRSVRRTRDLPRTLQRGQLVVALGASAGGVSPESANELLRKMGCFASTAPEETLNFGDYAEAMMMPAT